MPFYYNPPANSRELRQGEILQELWEYRQLQTTTDSPEDPAPVDSIRHELVVVLTADCDLLQDANARASDSPVDHHLISHVLVCDGWEGDPLRERFKERALWRRVEQNQDERYHHLDAADVYTEEAVLIERIPDLYLDFKRAFGLPPESIYQGLALGGVRRRVLIPPVYLEDLMHRFYGFLSRVSLPD